MPRRRSSSRTRSPGRMDVDLVNEPLGEDGDGNDVYLRDLWPSAEEIQETISTAVRGEMFSQHVRGRLHRRSGVARAARARGRSVRLGGRVDLRAAAAVLRRHAARARRRGGLRGRARASARVGDSVTTDHISPAGAIKPDSPAGQYLVEHGSRAEGLQLLRLAARQSRGDGARHVRERAAAQSARARLGGDVDGARAERRGDDDLRRVGALPGGGNAADRARGQGVRLGVVPRLGGEGPEPPRRPGRDRQSRTSGSTVRTC